MDGGDLRERMERLGLREGDLAEKFVRSPGPGGQNVNKTSTCVYIKHLPSGIEVKCSRERSQARNRETARLMLVGKLERRTAEKAGEERGRREKLRRQKRTRSARAKARMLEDKKRHSEKKKSRQSVREY